MGTPTGFSPVGRSLFPFHPPSPTAAKTAVFPRGQPQAPALSKFLNIETQAAEKRPVESAERGVGIADSAQSKYKGEFRIMSRTLDIEEADSPTTVCPDVEEPIIDLRKDSSVFVKIRMGHKTQIVRQDKTHLARIEMSGLLLNQLLI